jgi:hypothetical protein
VKAVEIKTLHEKEIVMKRIITVAAFAFTVILGVGKSQAQVPAVQVTVPFKFTAGDKALPAGAYTIMLASSGVIEIRNRAHGAPGEYAGRKRR